MNLQKMRRVFAEGIEKLTSFYSNRLFRVSNEEPRSASLEISRFLNVDKYIFVIEGVPPSSSSQERSSCGVHL